MLLMINVCVSKHSIPLLCFTFPCSPAKRSWLLSTLFRLISFWTVYSIHYQLYVVLLYSDNQFVDTVKKTGCKKKKNASLNSNVSVVSPHHYIILRYNLIDNLKEVKKYLTIKPTSIVLFWNILPHANCYQK